jgi:hypothetical protein
VTAIEGEGGDKNGFGVVFEVGLNVLPGIAGGAAASMRGEGEMDVKGETPPAASMRGEDEIGEMNVDGETGREGEIGEEIEFWVDERVAVAVRPFEVDERVSVAVRTFEVDVGVRVAVCTVPRIDANAYGFDTVPLVPPALPPLAPPRIGAPRPLRPPRLEAPPLFAAAAGSILEALPSLGIAILPTPHMVEYPVEIYR